MAATTFEAENGGYGGLFELLNLAIEAVTDIDDDTEEIWELKAEALGDLHGLEGEICLAVDSRKAQPDFDFDISYDRKSDASKAAFARDAMTLLANAIEEPAETSAAEALVELLEGRAE